MTSEEYIKNRYEIVFNALNLGIRIKYKLDWEIFLSNNEVYQFFKNPQNGKEIVHKSGLTLNDFLNFINKMETKELKRLFGDINLIKLQNKLIKGNE